MFVNACKTCRRMFVRDSPAPTVGQKFVGKSCPATRLNNVSPIGNKRGNCRGKLIDFVLDWEDELPESDLILSDSHSTLAELSIVIGSTLQIIPAGNMPTYTKKYQGAGKGHGRLVIINLQPTKHDKKADLLIRGFADTVMTKLFERLGVQIPCYDASNDPVKSITSLSPSKGNPPLIEWTQNSRKAKEIERLASIVEQDWKQKRKKDKINSHISSSTSKISESITEPEIVSQTNSIDLQAQELETTNKGDDITFKLNRDNEEFCYKKVKLSNDNTKNLASEINTQV